MSSIWNQSPVPLHFTHCSCGAGISGRVGALHFAGCTQPRNHRGVRSIIFFRSDEEPASARFLASSVSTRSCIKRPMPLSLVQATIWHIVDSMTRMVASMNGTSGPRALRCHTAARSFQH